MQQGERLAVVIALVEVVGAQQVRTAEPKRGLLLEPLRMVDALAYEIARLPLLEIDQQSAAAAEGANPRRGQRSG